MAGLQPLSTRAFGPRLRRLTALTALATRPLIATKRSTVRCGQSVCKCHAEKFRSAIFARILTAVHNSGRPRVPRTQMRLRKPRAASFSSASADRYALSPNTSLLVLVLSSSVSSTRLSCNAAIVLAAVKMLWGGSEGTYPSLH